LLHPERLRDHRLRPRGHQQAPRPRRVLARDDPRDDRRDLPALPQRVRVPHPDPRVRRRGPGPHGLRHHAHAPEDHGRAGAGGAGMKLREFSVVLAVAALFGVMAVSFLSPVSWPQSPTSVPVYDPNATLSNGIILNASILNFVAFSSYSGNPSGQIFALLGIAVAAAEAAVGLAVFLSIYQTHGSIELDKIRFLKW